MLISTLGLKIQLMSSDKGDMGTKLSVADLTDVAVNANQVCLCLRKYVAAICNTD